MVKLGLAIAFVVISLLALAHTIWRIDRGSQEASEDDNERGAENEFSDSMRAPEGVTMEKIEEAMSEKSEQTNSDTS